MLVVLCEREIKVDESLIVSELGITWPLIPWSSLSLVRRWSGKFSSPDLVVWTGGECGGGSASKGR